MGQIIHDISMPNDGLGDKLRVGFDHQNQMNTELYTTKVDKILGKDLSSEDFTSVEKAKLAGIEAGAQVNVPILWEDIVGVPAELNNSVGYFYYDNTITALSFSAATELQLTNNKLGTDTDGTHPPYGVTSLWDSTTNAFDFTQLNVGDSVDLRVDSTVTTAGTYSLFLRVGIGTPSEKDFPLDLNGISFPIISDDIKDYPAKIFIIGTATGTILVDGFFIRGIRSGLNIIDVIVETDAPIDGSLYGRKDEAWEVIPTASGATLGLIKIVDKAGDFFTNLATASAYIRTFTSATITNESFSNGTFWFTVPNDSSFDLIGGFLFDTPAYIEDTLGLITSFGSGCFGGANGHILGNCTFGNSCFDGQRGVTKLGNILLSSTSNFFAENSTGRFEIYGTIGTTTAANYTNFFPTSTAVIWALKVNETNNAGGLEGDLATAQTNGAKLFFGYADGGATDLSYTASPTNGIVTSSTGTDATIPLADGTNAGLLSPIEKTAIAEINKTQVKLSENINKGQVVYVSSANGTNIIVSKASNATEATSSKTLGLLETTGVTNDIVNVITFELLAGLNTSTATIGDPVWLGTSGNLIYGLASKPVAPAHLVYIGVVTRVSATVGEIFINIQNGFELKEIHDVLIDTPLNNQVLAYDTASGLWKNNGNFRQILHSDLVPTAAHTGTTTITQIGATIVIPANTFSANDAFILDSLGIAKTGTAGTCIWRLAQNTSDTITGANIIASASLTATQITGNMGRKFEINGGNLKCRIGGTTTNYTDMQASTTAGLSVTFDPTITQYFFRLATLSVGTDSVVGTQIVILK